MVLDVAGNGSPGMKKKKSDGERWKKRKVMIVNEDERGKTNREEKVVDNRDGREKEVDKGRQIREGNVVTEREKRDRKLIRKEGRKSGDG